MVWPLFAYLSPLFLLAVLWEVKLEAVCETSKWTEPMILFSKYMSMGYFDPASICSFYNTTASTSTLVSQSVTWGFKLSQLSPRARPPTIPNPDLTYHLHSRHRMQKDHPQPTNTCPSIPMGGPLYLLSELQ